MVRQERSNAARSDAVLAGEHAKIEELSGKIQCQARWRCGERRAT